MARTRGASSQGDRRERPTTSVRKGDRRGDGRGGGDDVVPDVTWFALSDLSITITNPRSNATL